MDDEEEPTRMPRGVENVPGRRRRGDTQSYAEADETFRNRLSVRAFQRRVERAESSRVKIVEDLFELDRLGP